MLPTSRPQVRTTCEVSKGLPRALVSCSLPFVATYQLDRLDALGDPTRRSIFERLVTRPMAVGELAGEPPGGVPAPQGAQGGGPGDRSGQRHETGVPGRPARGGRAAGLPGRVV